jgi:hypothetical protein
MIRLVCSIALVRVAKAGSLSYLFPSRVGVTTPNGKKRTLSDRPTDQKVGQHGEIWPLPTIERNPRPGDAWKNWRRWKEESGQNNVYLTCGRYTMCDVTPLPVGVSSSSPLWRSLTR